MRCGSSEGNPGKICKVTCTYRAQRTHRAQCVRWTHESRQHRFPPHYFVNIYLTESQSKAALTGKYSLPARLLFLTYFHKNILINTFKNFSQSHLNMWKCFQTYFCLGIIIFVLLIILQHITLIQNIFPIN